MGKITSDNIQYKLEEINSFLAIRYRMKHPGKERDWGHMSRNSPPGSNVYLKLRQFAKLIKRMFT